jgi:hypothetical protein
MRLSQPTFMTLLVSLVLAVISILAQIGVSLPVVGTYSWPPMLAAYVVLLAGVLIRGL